MAEDKGRQMESVESVWCILYSSFSCEAYHQLQYFFFFFPFWGYVDSVCATVLLKCFYLNSEALRKMWEGIFVSNSNYATGF